MPQLAAAPPSASLGGASGGGAVAAAAADDDDDDDDDVVCLGVGRAANAMPHARYDCTCYPLAEARGIVAQQQHCEQCWCARCSVPARECAAWASHCMFTAEEDAAAAKATRLASLERRLQALPRPPPLASGSEAMLTMQHPNWAATRFTALSWLANCGNDEEGVLATMVACHEIPESVAQRALRTLQAAGEVVTLDGELHVRPGTSLQPPPPPPPPPPMPHMPIHMPGMPPMMPHMPGMPPMMPHMPMAGHAVPPPAGAPRASNPAVPIHRGMPISHQAVRDLLAQSAQRHGR